MARLLTELVFDQTIRGTTQVLSQPQFNEIMGRGDTLTFEVEVEDASGTTPTITVAVAHSNSGKLFLPVATTPQINAESIASGALPYRKVFTYEAATVASLVQLQVTLGGTTPVARVRIWCCARSR